MQACKVISNDEMKTQGAPQFENDEGQMIAINDELALT